MPPTLLCNHLRVVKIGQTVPNPPIIIYTTTNKLANSGNSREKGASQSDRSQSSCRGGLIGRLSRPACMNADPFGNGVSLQNNVKIVKAIDYE